MLLTNWTEWEEDEGERGRAREGESKVFGSRGEEEGVLGVLGLKGLRMGYGLVAKNHQGLKIKFMTFFCDFFQRFFFSTDYFVKKKA